MKKSYVKPQVYFENFQLSADIAKGCTEELWHKANQTQDVCGYGMTGMAIFITGVTGCDVPIEDGTGTDKMCYHGPTGSYNLFDS